MNEKKTIVTNFVTITGPNPETVRKTIERTLNNQKDIKRTYLLTPNNEIEITNNTSNEYDYDDVFNQLKNDIGETIKNTKDLCGAICQFTTDTKPDADKTKDLTNDCTITWRWHLKDNNVVTDDRYTGQIKDAGYIKLTSGTIVKNEKLNTHTGINFREFVTFIDKYNIDICEECSECGKLYPVSEIKDEMCRPCHLLLNSLVQDNKDKTKSGGDS